MRVQKKIYIHGVRGSISVTPLRLCFECEFLVDQVFLGTVDQLPMHGVDFLLGNNIAGKRVNLIQLLSKKPVDVEATRQLV